jgi:hypothetical protein
VGKVDKRELREISARHFVDDEVHTDQEAANK